MTVALLLVLAAADPITAADYRDRLAAIRAAVERKDLDAARRGAAELQSLRVRHETMEFPTDRSVLKPIADAADLPAAQAAAGPLRPMIEALDALGPPKDAAPDPALLERLREEESARDPSKSGPADGPRLHRPHVPESFREWLLQLLKDLWEAVQRPIQRFLSWIFRAFFGSAGAVASGAKTTYLVVGLIACILGVVAIVAFVTLRRRAEAGPVAVSQAPAQSESDADPLSRTSNEWERFALELMKGGRHREAIRAWYHAVLVTVFRAGLLHYRKDRTNWEYAYALGPALPWRAGFVDATRTFEYEWYGRRDTARETSEAFAAACRLILEKLHEGGKA